MTAPTMTPETREELARAIRNDIIAALFWADPNHLGPYTWSLSFTLLEVLQRNAEAIAPVFERLVAERVAAETERCAGIAEDMPWASNESIAKAIRSATR